MICTGDSEGEAEIRARVEYAGVGITLKKPTIKSIENAYLSLVGNDVVNKNVKDMSKKMQESNGFENGRKQILNFLKELS